MNLDDIFPQGDGDRRGPRLAERIQRRISRHGCITAGPTLIRITGVKPFDRREHTFAVAQLVKAQFFQVGIGQREQGFGVNSVRLERRDVAIKAEG
jgi:hypothetical protein